MNAPSLVPTSRPLLRQAGDVAATAVVALGANLGDAPRTLAEARHELACSEGIGLHRSSRLFLTAPVGGPEQPDYVNAVLLVSTQMSPHELLARLGAVEAAHGRTREVRWGARTLDLDLIQYRTTPEGPGGPVDVECDDAVLTLPHPRAHLRGFVLVPWCDADPSATLLLPGGAVRPVAGVMREVGLEGTRPGPAWPEEVGPC